MQNIIYGISCNECLPYLLKFHNDLTSIYGDMSPFIIMQKCPYNEDPLTPHFYIVKLGVTGVYIIFLPLS